MEILSVGPILKEITGLLEYEEEKPLVNPIDRQKPATPQDITHPFGSEKETKKQGDTKAGS